MEEIIKTAAANGLWAVLFCLMLVYQLKESKLRENKYQSALMKLSENLSIVKVIKEDVEKIKDSIEVLQNKKTKKAYGSESDEQKQKL